MLINNSPSQSNQSSIRSPAEGHIAITDNYSLLNSIVHLTKPETKQDTTEKEDLSSSKNEYSQIEFIDKMNNLSVEEAKSPYPQGVLTNLKSLMNSDEVTNTITNDKGSFTPLGTKLIENDLSGRNYMLKSNMLDGSGRYSAHQTKTGNNFSTFVKQNALLNYYDISPKKNHQPASQSSTNVNPNQDILYFNKDQNNNKTSKDDQWKMTDYMNGFNDSQNNSIFSNGAHNNLNFINGNNDNNNNELEDDEDEDNEQSTHYLMKDLENKNYTQYHNNIQDNFRKSQLQHMNNNWENKQYNNHHGIQMQPMSPPISNNNHNNQNSYWNKGNNNRINQNLMQQQQDYQNDYFNNQFTNNMQMPFQLQQHPSPYMNNNNPNLPNSPFFQMIPKNMPYQVMNFQQQQQQRNNYPNQNQQSPYTINNSQNHNQQQQQQYFNKNQKKNNKMPLNHNNLTLNEILKKSNQLSRDQAGCRLLQKKIEEDSSRAQIILHNALENIQEIVNDTFGNYLIQKLFEYMSNQQLCQFMTLIKISILQVCINSYGTRVMQKLIEFLQSEETIITFINLTKSIFKDIILDINGSHILLKAIDRNEYPLTKAIYDEIADNIIKIASHKHGCCVLQKCIERAPNREKKHIINLLIFNCQKLIVEQCGNYIIQFLITLPDQEIHQRIAEHLVQRIAEFSQQKYSSNVIEKCFEKCDDLICQKLITALKHEEICVELLFDKYGNYVIQKALYKADKESQEFILNAIVPHLDQLKNYPFGFKLYSNLITNYSYLQKKIIIKTNDSNSVFSPNPHGMMYNRDNDDQADYNIGSEEDDEDGNYINEKHNNNNGNYLHF